MVGRALAGIRTRVALAAVAVFAMGFLAAGWAETVTGRVLDGSGQPVPNISVSMVSETLGRGPTVLTDRNGDFVFTSVPRSGEYYIEVYWGTELVFRRKFRVIADTDIGSIRL